MEEPKTEKITIVTHTGIFHADEVFACATLQLLYSEEIPVTVIRSRDPVDWIGADYLVDVGGEYDALNGKFDHHQPGFNSCREDGTLYSSFGLVWLAHGWQVVSYLLYDCMQKLKIYDSNLEFDVVDKVDNFVKSIDWQDQGQLNIVARNSSHSELICEVATIQSIISSFNPIPLVGYDLDDDAFKLAVGTAGIVLTRLILKKASEILAKPYIEARISKHSPFLYLEEFCTWYDVVKDHPHITHVIFPNQEKTAHVVTAVRMDGNQSNGPENLRIPFPKEWAGLTDQKLQAISGVEEAIFCHSAQFLATAKTIEGATKLAIAATKQNEL
jgi:uncharacterized UPF0160 family protein